MIIGGPAVRYSSPNEINIWLVLDAAANQIEAQASYQIDGGGVSRLAPDTRVPVQLGEKLFVYLLKLTPMLDRFDGRRKIYYDVKIDGLGLRELGLTSGKRKITYPGEALPSLIVPDRHASILHASCRKPHGGTGDVSTDQMVAADRVLAKGLKQPHVRPSMLFLTGDQIYADDVSAALITPLSERARELTGIDESLPSVTGGRRITPSAIRIGARGDNLKQRSTGFTSGQKHNHLMTFGEYMAMYLVVFGGLSITLPDYPSIRPDLKYTEKKDKNLKTRSRKYWMKKRVYEGQKQRVEDFLSHAWRVRRLMANISTYMIFDDHDVTDDWNLDADIHHKFQQVPLSRRLVSNALAAYWACQGWGNAPQNFSASFREALQQHLLNDNDQYATAFEEAIAQTTWWYTLEQHPYVLVMDTRTRRVYSGGKTAQLVAPELLDDFAAEMRRVRDNYQYSQDCIVIVSATPVLGFSKLELLQLKFTNSYTAAKIDAEPWIGNSTAFRNFHNMCLSVFTRDCVILSGDVHYAFNRKETIPVNQWAQQVRLLQLTSSSACNQPGGIAKLTAEMLASPSVLAPFCKEDTRYIYPKNSGDHFLSGDCNIGQLEFSGGLPNRYTLYFRDASSGERYRWNYDLAGKLQLL